ncbi:hypothetical protein OC842_006169 [Tilletia horrida]|uniref:Uncharacterized protein n=1 Tax=Tilletia horrida TaxID=155126 RepID=A0AAN6JNL8_9BASI|nr:hypothetical protein OC842_006169 [Tilletia horrida]
MTILLNWLQDEGNYDKWKGAEGDSQLALASDISQVINEAKKKVERTAPAIVEKVRDLYQESREAIPAGQRLSFGHRPGRQGIIDKAAAENAEDREEAIKLAEKSVEDALMNFRPYYFELVESDSDPAAATLRSAIASSMRYESIDDNFSEDDPDQDDEPIPASKKLKVKKEGAKGRPSESGRKFGKTDASTPRRKPSAIEAALEARSRERTKMDAELNSAKVKAERLGAIMGIARQLRASIASLNFQDAVDQAKVLYESI